MTTPIPRATRSVTPDQAGYRADRALCSLVPELNRRATKELFHSGAVRLNDKPARGSERVAEGDQLSFPDPGAPESQTLPVKDRSPRLTTHHGRQVLRIYEDEALMVLNKPAEIPIHRGADGLTRRETLEDVLERAYGKDFGMRNADFGLEGTAAASEEEESAIRDDEEAAVQSAIRPSAVNSGSKDNPQSAIRSSAFYFAHRLDMETTGCLLVAKTEVARDALIRDFEQRRIHKTYLAVVTGEPPWAKCVVKRPIQYVRSSEDGDGGRRVRSSGTDWAARKKFGRIVRAVKMGVALEEGSLKGKPCETAFHVEQRFRGYTLLRCEPKTGRMHQIRVHLAAEGFPLAYDRLYGRRSPLRMREFDGGDEEGGEAVVLNRMPLHAWKLEFTHPVSGERVQVEAPVPKDLKEFLRILRKFRSRG